MNLATRDNVYNIDAKSEPQTSPIRWAVGGRGVSVLAATVNLATWHNVYNIDAKSEPPDNPLREREVCDSGRCESCNLRQCV